MKNLWRLGGKSHWQTTWRAMGGLPPPLHPPMVLANTSLNARSRTTKSKHFPISSTLTHIQIWLFVAQWVDEIYFLYSLSKTLSWVTDRWSLKADGFPCASIYGDILCSQCFLMKIIVWERWISIIGRCRNCVPLCTMAFYALSYQSSVTISILSPLMYTKSSKAWDRGKAPARRGSGLES